MLYPFELRAQADLQINSKAPADFVSMSNADALRLRRARLVRDRGWEGHGFSRAARV